jgi:hypothetical protein
MGRHYEACRPFTFFEKIIWWFNNIVVYLHHQTNTMVKQYRISEDQIIKMNRKVSRDESLVDSNGWTATHKVHMSKKTYSRKEKHKNFW